MSNLNTAKKETYGLGVGVVEAGGDSGGQGVNLGGKGGALEGGKITGYIP